MQRLKAFGFLCLFLFSTVMTYASVHHCSGQITDVSILSEANCDHHQATEDDSHCKMSCCKKSLSNKTCHDNNEEENDCCETEELSTAKNLLTSAVAPDIQIISKILPSFYDFYFESHRVLKRTYGIAYVPPRLKRDVIIEVQSFLI